MARTARPAISKHVQRFPLPRGKTPASLRRRANRTPGPDRIVGTGGKPEKEEEQLMPSTQTLTGRCDELLAAFPEAAEGLEETGSTQLLTILLPDSRCIDLLVSTTRGMRRWSWRERGVTRFALITGDDNPALRQALTAGLPLPAGGTLFGWQQDNVISALVMFYSGLNPSIEPTWALCPHADAPQDLWPPFTGKTMLGRWFWEYLRTGHLVDLGPLVAETRETVFGVPCGPQFRGFCIAAKADVATGGYPLLPHGRYVDFKALRAGLTPPALDDLIADNRRVDLGPGFLID